MALSWLQRTFEYVELRRDPDKHGGDTLAEQDAVRRMRLAFEDQDMRALKQATRHYIRLAPRDED